MARVLSLVMFLLLTVSSAFAQQAVRLSWETFSKDPKRVAAFRKAVATMKARNTATPTSAQYRTSWTYWGNIHGYFGPDSPDGTVEDYIQWMKDNNIWNPAYQPFFDGVTDVTPPDQLAKEIWSTCQHGTPWFFAWHRLYLYYFERVLQVAAGDATLRLPYWDYTNAQFVGMPPEFTTPTYVNEQGQTVANPLYEKRRRPGWFATPPITLNANTTNINDALQVTPFLDPDENTPGYQSTIEQSPHGYVHCAVMNCPVTVMGAVPYSSNDPIFWLHHCNIDRMWTCWNSISGHTNPTSAAFRNKQFSFVNYRGQKVTNRVRDLFTTRMIDYVYEQPSNCARPATPVGGREGGGDTMTPSEAKAAKAAVAKKVVLGKAKNVALSGPVTSQTINVTGSATPRNLATRESAQVPVTTNLVLRNIQYDAHPGTIIHVYLARKDDPTKRSYVGAITFFVSPRHAGHGKLNRLFDVTEELRDLNLTGDAANQFDIVFEAAPAEPAGPGREAAPMFNERANLRVGEIEVHVKGKD